MVKCSYMWWWTPPVVDVNRRIDDDFDLMFVCVSRFFLIPLERMRICRTQNHHFFKMHMQISMQDTRAHDSVFKIDSLHCKSMSAASQLCIKLSCYRSKERPRPLHTRA